MSIRRLCGNYRQNKAGNQKDHFWAGRESPGKVCGKPGLKGSPKKGGGERI